MPLHNVENNDLLCPIGMELMKDPVQTEDGHTYERHAIEAWFRNHDTSPLTNAVLKSKKLVPNHFCKKTIQKYLVDNNICSFDNFIKSIKTGDRAVLEGLNYLESYVSEVVEKSFRHLSFAIQKGHFDCFIWLHEIGLDITACSNKKRTLLHHAAFSGQAEITEYLAARLPNIQARDSYYRTPLHCAAYRGAADCVRILLDCGAEPLALDSNKETPLHAAAKAQFKRVDYTACIEVLVVNYGANCYLENIRGETAVDVASLELGNYILELSEQVIQGSQNRAVSNLLLSFKNLIEDQSQQLKSSSEESNILSESIDIFSENIEALKSELNNKEKQNKKLNKEIRRLKSLVQQHERAKESLTLELRNLKITRRESVQQNRQTIFRNSTSNIGTALPRQERAYGMDPRFFPQPTTTTRTRRTSQKSDGCTVM